MRYDERPYGETVLSTLTFARLQFVDADPLIRGVTATR